MYFRGKFDFKNNPSTFWLIIKLTYSCRHNSRIIIWLSVGIVSSNDFDLSESTLSFVSTLTSSLCDDLLVVSASSTRLFCNNFVQTPDFPRKSGIPAEVLKPAPTWTTQDPSNWRSHSASISTFSLTLSSLSKTYTYRLSVNMRWLSLVSWWILHCKVIWMLHRLRLVTVE